MESLVAWAREIIEEKHGPPLSVIASDVLALVQRLEDAERDSTSLRKDLVRQKRIYDETLRQKRIYDETLQENERLREALRGVSSAYGDFAGCSAGTRNGALESEHTPSCRKARQALRQENRESASEESSDE